MPNSISDINIGRNQEFRVKVVENGFMICFYETIFVFNTTKEMFKFLDDILKKK